jgi:prepilin peptidase CpaA
LLFVLFPLGVAFAAASDLLTMTISNKISIALITGFVLLAPMTGMDWQTFAMHGAAGAVVLVIGFTCFAFGWIGGGDAKLAATIALWLGWGHTVAFIAQAAIFGGLLTLGILAYRGAVLPAFVVRQPWARRLHEKNEGVPYGIALAAAALAVYPQTVWLTLVTG